MDRIKVRQQKFKRGKEKMISLVQESVDGQPPVQPVKEEEDEGMMKADRDLSLVQSKFEKKSGVEVKWLLVGLKEGGWKCINALWT